MVVTLVLMQVTAMSCTLIVAERWKAITAIITVALASAGDHRYVSGITQIKERYGRSIEGITTQ
jgi:hypothetical protein